jgi:hypothetical protein
MIDKKYHCGEYSDQFNEDYLHDAFQKASRDEAYLTIGFCSHPMDALFPKEVMAVHRRLKKFSSEYDVDFEFVTCREAIKRFKGWEDNSPLTVTFLKESDRLVIKSSKTLWQPAPFCCFKTKRNKYGKLALKETGKCEWELPGASIPWDVTVLGVGGTDIYGNSSTKCQKMCRS